MGIREIAHSRTGAVIAGATVLVTLGGVGGAVAAGQITSSDVKNQTVQSWDISQGGVGASEMRNDSVGWYGHLNQFTRDKIESLAGQDGTDGKDGKDGEPGATGPAGPAGAQGPPGTVEYQGEHWSIIDRHVIGNGDAYLRSGPYAATFDRDETPPMGEGSLGLRTGSGDDKVVFGNEVDFAGDPVSGLNTVSYSVFSNGTTNSPNVQFEIDPMLENSHYSTMTFVPEAVTAGVWSSVDASTAKRWYLTGGAGISSGCSQGGYCTLDEVKDRVPNATIYAAQINKGRDTAFSGAVDALVINDSTFDFEPFGVTETTK